ncbi:MAG: hypothetical protein ACRDFS_09875 [Chloroflexota bacterium]
MPEETIKGVPIDVKNDKKWVMDYEPSDVEQIYKDARPQSWQDIVNYLEQHGDDEWHITPGEAVSMKSDFSRLAQSGTKFTDNPSQAYQDAHKYRGQDQKNEPAIARQMQNH